MRTGYEPESDFLKAVVAEEMLLSGSERAEENLRRVIVLTRDDNLSNRDWATFLLAQEPVDTPLVRAALISAAGDDDSIVRAEAVLGLAKRDVKLALPLVQQALRADTVAIPMLEAAVVCAHPSLIPDLRIWAEPSADWFADDVAAEALAACERAAPDSR
ncbi:MAG: lyase [Pseudomonadota bacterium]